MSMPWCNVLIGPCRREVTVTGGRVLEGRRRSEAIDAQYAVDLAELSEKQREDLARRLRTFEHDEHHEVLRTRRNKQRTVDLCAGVSELRLDGDMLRFTLRRCGKTTARIAELLEAWGLPAAMIACTCRTAVTFAPPLEDEGA